MNRLIRPFILSSLQLRTRTRVPVTRCTSVRSLSYLRHMPTTIDTHETLRKSLLWKSKQRGLRELDIILGSYADKYIHQMTLQQLNDYERIISIESPDLWSYLQDPKVIIPDHIKTLSLFHHIKDHMMSMSKITSSSQMDEIETLRKSLLWRSKQRGILELDLLVGSFATKYVPTMSLSELKEFQRLIALESPDLLKYLQDPKAIIPDEIATLPMFTSLKNHMINAHQSFEKNIMTGYAKQQGNQ